MYLYFDSVDTNLDTYLSPTFEVIIIDLKSKINSYEKSYKINGLLKSY